MYDRALNRYMIANIRQMPLPTNEPEHFEDWRPFMGYTDTDGCVVSYSIHWLWNILILYSGNSKLDQWSKHPLLSQSSWEIRKEILGICKITI